MSSRLGHYRAGPWALQSKKPTARGNNRHRHNVPRVRALRWLGQVWLEELREVAQAAMNIVCRDVKLRSFQARIRKRPGEHAARVALARKLAGIHWERLRQSDRDRTAA